MAAVRPRNVMEEAVMRTFTITRSPVTVATASAIALAAFLAAVSLIAPTYAAPHNGDRDEGGRGAEVADRGGDRDGDRDRDDRGRDARIADRGTAAPEDARMGGNLNAAHANANALEHANPNSMVGQIAAYKAAVEGGATAAEAQEQLGDISNKPVTVRVVEWINNLLVIVFAPPPSPTPTPPPTTTTATPTVPAPTP